MEYKNEWQITYDHPSCDEVVTKMTCPECGTTVIDYRASREDGGITWHEPPTFCPHCGRRNMNW